MLKKKILYHSDSSLAKTGFGRVSKALLKYLYKTNKYEIFHYCCSMKKSDPHHQVTPWTSIGCLPDSDQELQKLGQDQGVLRMANYGAYELDNAIKEIKPDLYIGVQDPWGVDYAVDRKWFDKIHSVIWTTLDSLPLYERSVEKAPKCKNYWVWSEFAEEAFKEIEINHIKTIHGCIDSKDFFRLPNDKRVQLRVENHIPKDAFVIGFVFRNQLRKSVPNLIAGYKLWKDKYKPQKQTRLLLHTSWVEDKSQSWNISKLAKDNKVPLEEILTTYICKICRRYQVKPYTGEELACKYCKSEKALITTSVKLGLFEEDLNEIYNLMDLYTQFCTSGAQEIPLQEAMLAENVCALNNYSFGEHICKDKENSGVVEVKGNLYYEHGTNFRKMSTDIDDIADKLEQVYQMAPEERLALGKKARDWAIKNYSSSNIGKIFEDFIDSLEPHNFDFNFEEEMKDPNYPFKTDIENDLDWVKDLYKNMLKMDLPNDDDGVKHWLSYLS